MRWTIRLSLSTILVLVACAVPTRHAAMSALSGACPSHSSVDMRGWESVDARAFMFRIPPDYQGGPREGVDSKVGTWHAANRSLHYDFGMHSNRLRPGPDQLDLVVCQDGASKTSPRIILYRTEEGRYAAAAHWAEVEPVPFGNTNFWNSLTLGGFVEHREPVAELLSIIHSVRFTR
ncbi:hypothetical protein BH23GEM5_BH23GEM5_11040 [soil metagenome]